ncbi:hypothetical protein HRbin09_01669 [bacterium HR09]|nr:hypothetical protein HRbin09_01669 [bacterium HR09]
MLNAGGLHVVGLAQGAVGVDADLGHHKQRKPCSAGGSAGGTGQDQMDDVFGEVLVAGGDEDLFAGNQVAAVFLLHRPGFGSAHVGAGLRLGEAHGAAPLAGVHLFHEKLPHLVGTELFDEVTGAAGEESRERKGNVGTKEELVDGGAYHFRQTHSAKLGGVDAGNPPTFAQLLVGVAEAGWHHHLAVHEPGAHAIAFLVGGCQHFGGKLVRLLQHHFQVPFCPLGKALGLQKLFRRQPLEELELHVPHVHLVRHGRPPFRFSRLGGRMNHHSVCTHGGRKARGYPKPAPGLQVLGKKRLQLPVLGWAQC